MKKHFLVLLWRFEKIENQLKKMEQDGYRLELVKRNFLFYFSNSEPKVTQYILTYSMSRETSPGMFFIEQDLLRDYDAKEISKNGTTFNVYRIVSNTGLNDLTGIKNYRNLYFKRVYLNFFLCSLLFLIISVFCCVFSKSLMLKILFDTISALCICCIVYFLSMIIILTKRCMKISQSEKEYFKRIIKERPWKKI